MTLPFAKITDAAPARAGDEVSSTLFNDYLVDGGDTYFRALSGFPNIGQAADMVASSWDGAAITRQMVIETLGNAVAVGFWLRRITGTVSLTLALNGTSQLAGSFSQIGRNQEKLVVLPAVDPGVNTITLTFTGGTLLEVRRIRCRELPHRN